MVGRIWIINRIRIRQNGSDPTGSGSATLLLTVDFETYNFAGDTPLGKPHNSGIREEDIELVDAQFDKDGNIVASGGLPPGQSVIAGAPSGFAGIPDDEDDRTQDEKDGVHSEDDGSEEDVPKKKKKKKEVVFQKSSS